MSDALTRALARPGGGGDAAGLATLLELLGRPDQAYPALRVAGGPGEGSIARMIACLLGALGLTSGALGARQLQDVTERIRLADAPVAAADLASVAEEVDPYLSEVDVRLGDRALDREAAVAALAFAHFADAPVDVAVVEAGADPAVAAQARGEATALSRLAPGAEVADLLDGVVVAAPQDPATEERLAREAAGRGAQLVVVGRDAAVADRRLAVGGQHLDLRGVTGEFEEVYLPLHGEHQAVNAVCALAAVEGFLGFAGGIDVEVIREAFAAVRLPGRLEVVRRTHDAPVVLDVADSAAAAEASAAALAAEFEVGRRVLVVALDDQADPTAVLGPLLALADAVVTTTVEGAMPAERLAGAVEADAEATGDPVTALTRASELAGAEDAVVVAGCAELVGQARTALGLGVA